MAVETLTIQSAIQQHQAQHFEQATQLYHQALQQNPEQAEALYGLGLLAQQQGDDQASEHWLLEALRVQPETAQTWFCLGNLYQAQGKLLEAAEAYWQALGLRPDAAPIFNNLGYTLQQLERWDEAVLCYQKALALQPGLAEAEVNLGNVLHTLGQLTADQQATLARANYQFGRTRWQQGDAKSALGYLRQAIALQPNFVDAQVDLDWMLHELDADAQSQVLPPTAVSHSIKPGIEIKSDLEILGKISGTLWNWAKTGFSVVDKSTFEQRYTACLQCPNLTDAPPKLLYRVITANRSQEKICKLCGCIVETKARIASETCPAQHPMHSSLNRWEEPFRP